jgi:16S rRNA (guanine(966)-N(2))-methyltransferase RsmD
LSNTIAWKNTAALDLFSGTGSIAVELLSRGCPEVTCVEKEAAHYSFIQKIKSELKDPHLAPVRADVFRFINTCARSFDLIFADPPYSLPELEKIPELIFRNRLLNAGGLLILEHPKEYDFSRFPGFEQKRTYGSVNFSLIINAKTPEEETPAVALRDPDRTTHPQ